MGYQKIENLLDNASNQPSKFWTKIWVEIIDESRGNTLLINKWNLKRQC